MKYNYNNMTDPKMRQSTVARFVALGHDEDARRDLMTEWGYGPSLRALSRFKLEELYTHLGVQIAKNRQPRRPEAFNLDQQGRFIWSLKQQAGWNDRRFRKLLIKQFHATHINCLDDKEKRQLINIMKGYVKQQEEKK